MKKITLVLTLLLCVVVGVNAEEYVVYQPAAPEKVYYTSSSDNYQPEIKIPGLVEGDIIKIHVTNVSSNFSYNVIWRGLTSDDYRWLTLFSGSSCENGVITYTVAKSDYTIDATEHATTAAGVAASIETRGITLTGNFKLLDVTVERSGKNSGETTIISSSTDLGTGWGVTLNLYGGSISYASAKVGDILRVSYTTQVCSGENWGGFQIQNSDAGKILTNSSGVSYQSASPTEKTFNVTIDNTILTALTNSKACIKGAYATITGVTLVSGLYQTVSTTEQYYGNWTNNYNISAVQASNTKVGDVINVFYTIGKNGDDDYTDGEIFFRNSNAGWAKIAGFSVSGLKTGSGTLQFVVTATLLPILQGGYVNVSGCGAGGTNESNGIQGTGVSITHLDPDWAGYRPVYIPAGGYATFYGASTCALPDGVSAYYVGTVADNKAKLTSISNIPANKGVILQGSTGIYQLYTTTDAAASVTDNMLTGAVTRQQITDATNKYVLYDNSGSPEFRSIQEDTYLDAYKCYLTAEAEAHILNIVFDEGETTAINTVENKPAVINDNRYYNLAGQQVCNPGKGLYIVNGKKFVIK